MNKSAYHLQMQWTSPGDVTSILMVIGGDVVQKALAQGTGKPYTPVCFSFGCVAYAFVSLVGIIGDGRLLPPPDYPVKVFNLKSGYQRENKSWVVGRILRDLESLLWRTDPLEDNALRISVFEAAPNINDLTSFSWGWIHVSGALITTVQLALALIPVVLDSEWTVLMIVVAGTLLIQITGLLPQWRAEKLPHKQRSNHVYALTSGNGSAEVIVIFGRGNCLDLEELCASSSPRTTRPWKKFRLCSGSKHRSGGMRESRSGEGQWNESVNIHGIPMGFWVTRTVIPMLSVLWLLLLINVAAETRYTWNLLGVGAIGMFQNAWLAAMERRSEKHNLPLIPIDTIKTQKVMDGLMDFETVYRYGMPLLREYFPGKLRPLEYQWWHAQDEKEKDAYEDERSKNGVSRGRSRRAEGGLIRSFASPAHAPAHASRVIDAQDSFGRKERSSISACEQMGRSDVHEETPQESRLAVPGPAHMLHRDVPPRLRPERDMTPDTRIG